MKPLRKEDKRVLFEGMNRAMGKELVNKVWEITAYRYYFLRKRGIIVDGKNI